MEAFRSSWYSWFWIAWVASAIVVEVVALIRPGLHDTLSEHVWFLMQRRPVWIWIIGCFLTWLLVHFLSKGRLG